MQEYYIADGNQRRGPFPISQLQAQGLMPDSLVWCEGMADWLPASQVPALSPYLHPGPPPMPGRPVPAQLIPGQPNAAGGQYPPAYVASSPYPPNVYPPPGYGQPNYPPQQYPMQYATPSYHRDSPGMGIASLILGVLSLLFSWVACFGLIASVLAVIFGAVGANRREGKGMAIAGMVCGILVLSIYLVGILFFGFAVSQVWRKY